MVGILNSRFSKAATTSPGRTETVRWVVIAIVNWVEAAVMRSKLESAGIPCMLQREAVGAAFGITIGPLGEVKVLAPESFAQNAVDLLSENVVIDEIDDDFEESSNAQSSD